MSSFWVPRPATATTQRLAPSSADCGVPPALVYCEILNKREMFNAPFCAREDRHAAFPIAQSKIILPEFDADYFSWGFNDFVSERLRGVMAVDSSAVRFFEVDASYSAQVIEPIN